MTTKRMRVLTTSLIAVGGLLASLAATAQPPRQRVKATEGQEASERHRRGPQSPLQVMNRVLDLSEDQTAALKEIFERQRESGQVDRMAQRENREALHAELESDNPDATMIGELMLAGRDLREQAKAQREELQVEINSVLTDEQQATWEGFQKGRRGRDSRMRGPRGPRGARGEAGRRGPGGPQGGPLG